MKSSCWPGGWYYAAATPSRKPPAQGAPFSTAWAVHGCTQPLAAPLRPCLPGGPLLPPPDGGVTTRRFPTTATAASQPGQHPVLLPLPSLSTWPGHVCCSSSPSAAAGPTTLPLDPPQAYWQTHHRVTHPSTLLLRHLPYRQPTSEQPASQHTSKQASQPVIQPASFLSQSVAGREAGWRRGLARTPAAHPTGTQGAPQRQGQHPRGRP